jgi:type VI secretion system protein ImpG
MRDDLLFYYERELTYIRKMALQFSEKYPRIASRLQLEPDKCEDPHVERLLEGFAFLAARVHLKIDDDFPEISEAMMSVIYPQFVRPIPSMSIVEFQLDGKITTGYPIPRNSTLSSKPVQGFRCKFRTCYDTTLWPLNVVAAEWKAPDRLKVPIPGTNAAGALRLELQCQPDVVFPKLRTPKGAGEGEPLNRLRFYLNGDSSVVNTLYELLCANLMRIVIRDPSTTRVKPVTLPASALKPVGFGEDEAVIPYSSRSFLGYRLLQEYFTFPEKFLFMDLEGLAEVWPNGFKDRVEVIFLISSFEPDYQQRLELGIDHRTFRLSCCPIINLFEQTAEPILLNQRKYEYPIVPDVRRPNAVEVFSIDKVMILNPQTHETINFEPFYSFQHGREKQENFWLAKRRPSGRPHDEGTEVDIALCDLSQRPLDIDTDALTLKLTCTNRDLPARLPFGNEDGDFELEANASLKRIIALHKPTTPIRPPMGKSVMWRLISQLSLNHLSLVEGGGRYALQQILQLYNFTDSAAARKIIEGILDVQSERHFARVVSDAEISFARGTRVKMLLDESQFVGNGVYLFASVIEYFLALYCTINSFSQLVVSTKQRREILHEWLPRAGRKVLM